MSMFNYQCDEDYQKIKDVSQNYPQLTTFEKEWLFFDRYGYMPGLPVELEYQTVQTNDTATVLNAIPYHYKSAILKGSTKYRDIDTGDILDTFDETKNLELVSVKVPVLTTTGKNLWRTDLLSSAEIDTYYQSTNYTLKQLCPDLIVGETYTFSMDYQYTGSTTGIVGIATLSPFTDLTYKPIIYTEELGSSLIYLYGGNAIGTMTNFQVEQGSVATPYEPYKSNILTTPEDLELRGIDDVQDTLDLLTGEVIERIGEVVLDGSENWVKPSNQPTNTVKFLLPDFPNNRNTKIKSNFKVKKNAMNDEIGIWCDVNTVLNLDTSVDTVDSLKVFLSKNPIKLQYSLATESIKTVDLTSLLDKPFEGINHYQVSSDTINPTFICEVPIVSEGEQTLAEINQETYQNL